jgi:hypothetical protein
MINYIYPVRYSSNMLFRVLNALLSPSNARPKQVLSCFNFTCTYLLICVMQGKKGVWLQIVEEQSDLVPIAIQVMFHCLIMQKLALI